MKHRQPEEKEQINKEANENSREKFLRLWNIVPKQNSVYGAFYPGAGEYAPSKVIAGKPLE